MEFLYSIEVLHLSAKTSFSPECLAQAQRAADSLLRNLPAFYTEAKKGEDLGRWQNWGERVRTEADTLFLIGIGGSSLGAEVYQQFYSLESSTKELIVLDHLDEEILGAALKKSNLSRSHFLFVSKSGKTIETHALLSYLETFWSRHFPQLNCQKQITVVTEANANPLRDWASRKQVPIMEMPQEVGGRFSVFTAVGALPAVFLGLNLRDIQTGAMRALERRAQIQDFIAFALEGWKREAWVTVFWSYDERLRQFTRWFQQLWSESLGKRVCRDGVRAPRTSTPMLAWGVRDQHSLLQQFVEGFQDKSYIIFNSSQETKKDSALPLSANDFYPEFKSKTLRDIQIAEAQSVQESLAEQGASVMNVELKPLDVQTLSELMMFCELCISGLGEVLGINPYDQPGVEAGKRRARELLQK